MPNAIEQGPPGRSNTVSTTTRGIDATTELLLRTIPACSACNGPLDDHSYRFYACHPVSPADALDQRPSTFLKAIHDEDWARVQANQVPAVNQPLYVLYAIICPHPPDGSGMVALLRNQPDARTSHTLVEHMNLTPESMALLRAQCPTCPWINFTPGMD